MELNLTKSYLNTLISNYEKNIGPYFTRQGFIDALKDFGSEHYKLFMGISRQLNGKKILEIGTHHGNSSIAFGYGKLFGNDISIDTYDIVDILQENPKKFFEKYNINYFLENLMDEKMREKNKEKILSYDIIFIDIAPHIGILEYDMYLWLKNNNYKGLIIYDDIGWDFQGPMQVFWNKIDDKYKKNLTYLGHWSGTGFVCFDFNKYNILY